MKTPRKCGGCGEAGHNKKTCTKQATIVMTQANVEEKKYVLVLTTGGKQFTSAGDTMEEAIANLNHPDKISTKGELHAMYGDLRHKLNLTPLAMKRFFYPMSRGFMAKNLINGLKST
jgi:hypothetical protein